MTLLHRILPDSVAESGPEPAGSRARALPDGSPASLSLALQGGGAFGAFTWGVLDRLLERGHPPIEAISGASAGAVNAVLVADGLRRGGPEAARANLDRFWTTLGRTPRGFVDPSRTALALDVSTRLLSPYQLNPFNLNPLKTILGEIVDFAALRAAPPVGLVVSATRISDGTLRIFREGEITLEAVMASTCLPHLHHAVEIEGEAYWDGGYAANPPIIQLVEAFHPEAILIVQIIPSGGAGHPRTSPHIVKRLNQITFNAPLHHDIEAIRTLKRILDRDGDDSEIARRVARLTLSLVAAEDWFPDLAERSLLDTDGRFLLELKEHGRRSVDREGAEPAPEPRLLRRA